MTALEESGGVTVVTCRTGQVNGPVSAWILQEGDVTVLVDTGQDAADADKIEATLAEMGIALDRVAAIVLTHRHGDHVGGLASLAPAVRKVLAHAEDGERIHAMTGIETDELGAGSLPSLPDVEVIPMPGHTPGSVALYWHSRRALIASDTLFSAGRHLLPPPPYLCDDPDAAIASINSLIARDLPIEAVLVGHGDDIFIDGQTRLRRIQAGRRDNNG